MTWEKVKLGDVYDVHNGLSKGGQYFGSGYPFLSFSTVFNHYFIPDEITEFVQSTEKEQENYSIKRGDVFITRTSETFDELGMSCVALKDYPQATYNGFTKRLRPKTNKILPEFIGYYFRTPAFRNEFQAFSTMTTRASLRNQELLGLSIPVPPMEMQKRIADVLSAYDDLIENNERQIRLLEEAAQRLYKEWFVRLHFPGYESTPVKDGMPEGWKKDRADAFFQITIGKTPPRSEQKCFTVGEKGVPWVSIADMGNAHTFIAETEEGLTEEAIEKYHVKVIPADTILLSFKLTVGRVAIATSEMCTNEAIAHFRLLHKWQREYVYCYLSAFHYDSLGSTSSISKAINSQMVKAMPFIMPDEKVVREFSKLACPLFEAIYICVAQNKLLQEARDRLLPKLMNGEIEV